jgi:hypothetical protein
LEQPISSAEAPLELFWRHHNWVKWLVAKKRGQELAHLKHALKKRPGRLFDDEEIQVTVRRWVAVGV